MAGGGQGEKKSKGCKKAGNNKEHCKAYWSSDQPALNKLRRILRSNKPEEALAWAKDHAAFGALHKLRQKAPGVFKRASERSEAFRKFADGK